MVDRLEPIFHPQARRQLSQRDDSPMGNLAPYASRTACSVRLACGERGAPGPLLIATENLNAAANEPNV
jgi:hypothetical protein